MRKILICLLFACGLIAKGQVYNNEWIDYNKTYYKFKLRPSGSNTGGVYRIPHSVLTAAGLGNIPAEQFQLWRDGEQVPVYTSVASGLMGSNDYIEFWGEKNNGKADKGLYLKPEYHLNDHHSLISDSASYFLTVNPAGGNSRLTPMANETAGNTLSPEPYFMHTIGQYGNVLNKGKFSYVGQYLYSSSYDIGEGYTSNNIDSGTTYSVTHSNLFVYPSGPDPKFKISVSGNNDSTSRNYKVVVNTDSILGKTLYLFDYSTDSANFPLSVISSGTVSVKLNHTAVKFINHNGEEVMRAGNMLLHKYELTYPRQFNFGASKNFEFSLPASANNRYLQITNFAFGTVAPVLYDLTNGRRYIGDISAKPLVKFVIQPSSDARYVLVNEEAANKSSITFLNQRNFINFAEAAHQGDFIIISNPLLFNGINGINPVEEYKTYRKSAAGGGYDAKVYLVDDLTDQFAFGINKHPVGLRNFILFARNRFATAPKHVLLLGKGVVYITQRGSETNAEINKLNLVPTWGSPASDVMLAADPGSSVGKVSIGRISAINGQEVKDYLEKVKEFEAAQALSSPEANDKLWMKNVLHIVGTRDPSQKRRLENYMSGLHSIISDTLYGAKVTTLTKQTGSEVEQISSVLLNNLFAEGMSLMTYFGHSAASTLSFNLDKPENYNNKGKYPMFIAMGCNVGDMYGFSTVRYSEKQSLSETYVLAPGKGTIGFIASTDFGLETILANWSRHVYNTISKTDYDKPIGEILNITAARVASEKPHVDFFDRCNIEQTSYHGDPSIKLNTHAKPDYAVNDQLVKVSPGFVSISETSFKVKAGFVNIGKAVDRDIAIEVKREFPDRTSQIVYKDTISHLVLADSVVLILPIEPQRDKGLNKLTITIDADNVVDELYESNNSIVKEVFIYEDEARPIYPYNFAIVNDPKVVLCASTADPLSPLKDYKFEMDTTELFNSPLKVTKTVNSKGGVLEFKPEVTLVDNTVYYWRVAMAPASGEYNWNGASFIYLKDGEEGFNQSHYWQHLKSESNTLRLDSIQRIFKFGEINNELFIKHAMWSTATGQEGDVVVNVNGDSYIRNTCGFGIVFNVFDEHTFKPWINKNINGKGLYGSSVPCATNRIHNFEFSNDTSGRRLALGFLKSIPNGSYVVVRNQVMNDSLRHQLVDKWIADEVYYGNENSLYAELKKSGFTLIDSLNRLRVFVFVFQKGIPSYHAKQILSQGKFDKITLVAFCESDADNGSLSSPIFGPAKSWKEFQWEGESLEDSNSEDSTIIKIIGLKKDGGKDTLFSNIGIRQKLVDISLISSSQYPFLQLHMYNSDTANFTPHQLRSWRLTYEPVVEGAIAPNIYFHMKDTLEAGENIDFQLAFKNVSTVSFDSLKINIVITNENNVRHVLPTTKLRPLTSNDTIHINYPIDSRQFIGKNTLFVELNPDNDQPEKFHFNNFIYYDFYVHKDQLNPLLDVTFDNIHILNGDIVSSKPDILVKMKDESSKLLLNDSSLLTVKVRYPGGAIRTIAADNDTLRFIPATQATDNIATISFKPYFTEDGEYELMVSGEDRSGNKAGNADYKVAFHVINKPMISNMLNYPNPFTTSTAFVFTLTGSEVPQNMKIQILTVTGKVVREITKQELGTIRIGRNLTEFKWDGTDRYGQKLANGVYLYRVVTSLNSKSLDKYNVDENITDKFFNKGYGKMYLMR